MVRNTSKAQYAALMKTPRILNLEDPAYASAMAPYRNACGLPPLHFEPAPPDFSGSWVLNEGRSVLGRMGAGFASARLDVVQHGNELTVRTTRILEYADDQVSEEKLTLDGAESKSVFMNSPRVTTAHLSADGKQLTMDSTVILVWGPPGSKLTVKDIWELSGGGDVLSIRRSTNSFMGSQETTLAFDRR
jgi:hypothetical protein